MDSDPNIADVDDLMPGDEVDAGGATTTADPSSMTPVIGRFILATAPFQAAAAEDPDLNIADVDDRVFLAMEHALAAGILPSEADNLQRWLCVNELWS